MCVRERDEWYIQVDLNFPCTPLLLMCFECVHYESPWWLACLCLHVMNKTPGEQRRLDLFREEALLCAVWQIWRGSYSLCNPTAAVALCNSRKSRSQIPIRSSRERVGEGRVNGVGDNVSVYSTRIFCLFLPFKCSQYEFSFKTTHCIYNNKSIRKISPVRRWLAVYWGLYSACCAAFLTV